MTVREFLNGVGNIQEYSRKSKVLLFTYYLRQHHGLLQFSGADIRRCFNEALLKNPSALYDLLKSLSRGRNSPLMKGTRPGSYALAMPGLNEVETYLGVKAKPETEVDTLLKSAIPYLEKVIAKLSDVNQRKLLAESIACLGVDAKRTNCGTVLTRSSFYFHSFKSIRRESWREWGKILIFAFTCWGDGGRGELEGIWGFETIISSKGRSSFGDLVGIGKDRKKEG